MIAKVVAVCVALLLMGGTVRAAELQVASATTVELVDLASPPAAPVEPVTAIVPFRHAVALAMPELRAPIASVVAPRMDRPPRN